MAFGRNISDRFLKISTFGKSSDCMNSKAEKKNIVPARFQVVCDFLKKYSYYIIGSIYLLAILCVNAIPLDSLVVLAPFLYLLGTGFIFVSHERPLKNILLYFGSVIFLGFIIELIAVQTQAVFGAFSFGDTLGLKILGTPLLIGFHWFLLSICSGYFIRWIFESSVMKVIGGALLMVIAFVITDPVAQSLDIWSWENYSFTFQNYSIHFLVSISMQVLFLIFLKKEKNQFAGYFLIITTLFFIISNIVL